MKWDTCYHFEECFSKFNAGDWEVWLELFSRWDIEDDMNISYGLAITIEELLFLLNNFINNIQNCLQEFTKDLFFVRLRMVTFLV